MDITRLNFIDLLPEISETIRNCDFIAVDTELSGLMRSRCLDKADSTGQRFAKFVESSRGYFILQFGLSCFTRRDNNNLEYDNRTYNFYIFPQADSKLADVNRTFSLQTHAIKFLSDHGFDFNKLFNDGLSYLTFKEKKALKEQIKSDNKGLGGSELKNELIIAKGFLEVLELIIINKKPIVGHNLSLDLIQIINQFIEPLTDDYAIFKELCHSLLPSIYDTKYIAHSILAPETLTNNQSRLNDLYCQLRDSDTFPSVTVNHLQENLEEKNMPHQAGYDAYMSGYCFIALCEAFLQEKKKHKIKKEEPNSRKISLALDGQVVKNFCNKIHLSYSHQYKCFNLSGDNEK